MNTSELITSQHLAREAIVYIRQSSPNQVLTHQESLELQYALREKAIDLGWRIANIQIIDSDLGLTGTSIDKREGFKEIVTKVTLGKVGIILSYDVTRLSRNCSDWYPLLDICGYKQCLIADRDGIYDPGTINGRLLLGLKGQLAEMELSTIKARLHAGLLNKAQRGDLVIRLPIGFLRDARNNVCKDSNLEVQHRVKLVFDTFLEKQKITRVVKYFKENELALPKYNCFGELKWQEVNAQAINIMLKNPAYAGAFAYGRTRTTRKELSSSSKKTSRMPLEQWRFLVKDKYPAYIDWEAFEKIQGILMNNYAEYTRKHGRGITRNGPAFLHGIIYCGECGHKMEVVYKEKGRYVCSHLSRQRLMPQCQNLPAEIIDNYVIPKFFEALNPIELDAYTISINSYLESEDKVTKIHEQQLLRLKYEAKLAERQFNQVDPENRLVAAELEKRWELALNELKKTEDEYTQRSEKKNFPPLSQEMKKAFIDIGKNLPEIWEQPILSRQQKKAFLRCLIDKIVAHRIRSDCLEVRIVWKGGKTTTSNLSIGVGSLSKLSTFEEMEKIIKELSIAGKSDFEISRYLTNRGYRSAKNVVVSEKTVQFIRLKHDIYKRKKLPNNKIPGYLTAPQVAKKIGVTKCWIYRLIKNGEIKIHKTSKRKREKYLFEDTTETVKILQGIKEHYK